MIAVLRRELGAYFSSPIGYIYLAVFYFFAGYYFTFGPLRMDSANIAPVFGSMFVLALFLIPVLTMRLLSEDRKLKTDQLLLTSPATLTGIVLGKFLAAVCVYLLGMAALLLQAFIVSLFAPPGWALVFGNFIALLLLGMALISIGTFISSLTENQVIAAVGGFAAGFVLLLLDALAASTTNVTLQKIIGGISFSKRYTGFSSGVFSLADIFFFLSVAALFVFFTVRVLEKRRWS